ncbi:nucleotidyltransferase domain-containing protein [Kribbella sp. NPDC051770]|uniref:nucleotidyltransferase domain-containing protein n=1 Tax=Kribbella sp. NPDC051770 TaxID=3155413 RepID=UPI0034153D60
MEDAARWRLEAVRPLLSAYAETAGVDAVIVGGSTARGDADRWSDVEVGVFWERSPTTEERRSVPAAADVRLVNQGPPWNDQLHLGTKAGLMVEVEHNLTSSVERTLDSVLTEHSTDGTALGLVQGIVDGREIAGVRADVVRRWQARAAAYPRGLAVAVVEYNGAIEKFWRLTMLAERENPLLVAREKPARK